MGDINIGGNFIHTWERMQQDSIRFCFGSKQLTCDLVIGRCHTVLASFLARFGVVGLDDRLNQNDISIGDSLLNVFGFFEI